MNGNHSLAQTLHPEADVGVGHSGSRHVHNATVWLALQCVAGLCGERRNAGGFIMCNQLFITLKL